MNNVNLNPEHNTYNHNHNIKCNSKQGTLKFDIPVIEDKIVVGNKKNEN